MTNTQIPEAVTAYRVAEWCNEALKEEDLDPITSQQVYRYKAEGLLTTVRVGDQDLIPTRDAVAWIKKYVAARKAKAEGGAGSTGAVSLADVLAVTDADAADEDETEQV